MAQITQLGPYQPRNEDMTEREFAEHVLAENQFFLVDLARITRQYAETGRSDKFYILVKAINLTLNLAQMHMKRTLGIDHAKMN